MNEYLENPALIGLVIAIPSFILGLLAYKRSVKVDKTTAQSQSETNQIGAVNQVIDNLNKLVETYQKDNEIQRKIVDELNLKLDIATAKIDKLTEEVRALNAKISV